MYIKANLYNLLMNLTYTLSIIQNYHINCNILCQHTINQLFNQLIHFQDKILFDQIEQQKQESKNKFNQNQQTLLSSTIINPLFYSSTQSMKARTQRIHFMGFSNRNPSTGTRTATAELYQKSFIKSKSQYYQTTDKISYTDNFNNQNSSLKKPYSTSQLNINTVYKDAEKGHHHEFQSKRLTKKEKQLSSFYGDNIYLAPLPLNLNQKLNAQIQQIRNDFKDKEINLHKLNELKHTFLRNNEKRRNLKSLFTQFANQSGVVDKNGFKRLIKDYGYDINDHEVNLVFRLNKIHDKTQSTQQDIKGLELPQFVNLMTKQNVYFKTLKLDNKNQMPVSNGYKFTPPDFQIFRNKFSKLKEAFNVYKGEPIDAIKFEKVMKKLDINDLVMKQGKRQQIFNNFTHEDGSLNVQQLLGVIATQQHQRVKRSGNQLKVTNHDNFEQNINANEEFNFEKNQSKDPLLDILYPVNLKKTSFVDFQRNLKAAQQICDKLKEIKQSSNRDVIQQVCAFSSSIRKEELYKKVQKLLQSEGYNFSKNEYKSFISYLDFDSSNQISNQKLENLILNENQKQRVNRLDRRVRNDKLNEQNTQFKTTDDQFVQKFRSKSSMNWNSVKKSTIKEENIPEFKVPTKFSAWPDRLYNADFTLVQAKSTFGMGITENQRFHKDQKHSYAQQDRLRKLKIYENKVRKIAEWSDVNNRRLEEKMHVEQNNQAAKQYNMRLIKEQYEERCHSHSLAQ